TLQQALAGVRKLPQRTVNVRYANGARPAESAAVLEALARAEAAVDGHGRAFLRPSGTEPVVRVTVEADDEALMQSTLDQLAAAVRAAAEAGAGTCSRRPARRRGPIGMRAGRCRTPP